ncbi:MAG: hypothetical protein SFY70_10715 [Bacteroidia bacterium]|nr:hypothetical protein [Bacteroidia bacterium]
MIIVYGTSHLKASKESLPVNLAEPEEPTALNEPTTGEPQAQPAPQWLNVDVFVQYFYLFWIPIFPFKKLVGFKEGGKIYSLKTENLSAKDAEAVAAFKKVTRMPVASFAGLILLVGILIFGAISDFASGSGASDSFATASFEYSKTEPYTPQVNDIFVLRVGELGKQSYAVCKILGLEADSFQVRLGNTFEYTTTKYGIETGTSRTDPSGSEIKAYITENVLSKPDAFVLTEDSMDLNFSSSELNEAREDGRLIYVYRE